MPSIVIQSDLANDRESFSVNFFPSDPGRPKFSQHGYVEVKKTLNLVKKKTLYQGVLPYKKERGCSSYLQGRTIKKVLGGGWDFFS